MRASAPSLSVADIVAQLGGELQGDGTPTIRGVGTLANARCDQAAFLAHGKYRKQLHDTQAGVVILAPSEAVSTSRTCIVCSDPYAYFARLSLMLNPAPVVTPGVHPAAVVDLSAEVHPSAYVNALVCIGAGAIIGPHVLIEAGAVIGERVRIGAHSVINANVVIYHDCQLGERVILHAGVVIGADGFGYAPLEGRWTKIPQVGRVLIANDVEVGANTTIDRGALDDTVIEEGVKLDNQIQVGHNVHIGAHTAIAGCVAIAGSAKIGKGCRIGGAAMIAGHLEIGDGVDISGGTAITKSIRTPGIYTALLPFVSHDRWRKNAVHMRNLDAVAQQIKTLEERVKMLEGKR